MKSPVAPNLSQRIFYNINWIFIEKISKAGLTALTSILVARYLGASGLGTISIALTVYSVFAVIGTLGLERILLKELEVSTTQPEKLIGGAVVLRLVGALLAFAGINLLVPLAYPDNNNLQWMVMLMSFAFFIAVGNILEVFYRRQLRSKFVTIVRVLGLFASALTKLLLILTEKDVVWFILPVLIETSVVTVSFLYLRLRDSELQLPPLQYRPDESRRILSLAWPLVISGFVGTLYFQLDKVVIFEFLDEASLGRYTLLFQLVSILLFLVHSINLSVTPLLNKLYFESRNRFWDVFEEVTAIKLLLALLLGGGLTLTGNFFIPLLAGADFTYSTDLLFMFSLYFALVSLGSLLAEYCVLIGVVKPLFFLRIITLLLNFGMNIWLIPLWGLSGAAFASVMSYFLNQFILPLLIPAMRPAVKHSYLALGRLGTARLYSVVYARCRQLV